MWFLIDSEVENKRKHWDPKAKMSTKWDQKAEVETDGLISVALCAYSLGNLKLCRNAIKDTGIVCRRELQPVSLVNQVTTKFDASLTIGLGNFCLLASDCRMKHAVHLTCKWIREWVSPKWEVEARTKLNTGVGTFHAALMLLKLWDEINVMGCYTVQPVGPYIGKCKHKESCFSRITLESIASHSSLKTVSAGDDFTIKVLHLKR